MTLQVSHSHTASTETRELGEDAIYIEQADAALTRLLSALAVLSTSAASEETRKTAHKFSLGIFDARNDECWGGLVLRARDAFAVADVRPIRVEPKVANSGMSDLLESKTTKRAQMEAAE